jgi:hypothetical protein
MNIAICLSGQNRPKQFNYDFINQFVGYKNIDVFCHLWSDDINNEVVEKLKPKKYIFESQKNFDEESLMISKPFLKIKFKTRFISDVLDWDWNVGTEKIISNRVFFGKYCEITRDQNLMLKNIFNFFKATYSMYYSIHRCNEIKNLYERINNIKYDLVIRARLDSHIQNIIDVSKLDKNYLYTTHSTKCISDLLAISNKENMDAYCSTYFNLLTILKDIYENKNINYFCNESFLYQSLINQNVVTKILENNTCNVIRT